MNKLSLMTAIFLLMSFDLTAQETDYIASINTHRDKYVKGHGAVKEKDKRHIRFFPPAAEYAITASIERIYEAPWFRMETSDGSHKLYRVYAVLRFNFHDTLLKLHVYESQDLMKTKQYADHLFIPFTDRTCGEESYDNGRYIDMSKNDMESDRYVIDFNKAYNPYCAYISNRYSCPVPPKENDLPVAIRAGEMRFEKSH